MIWDHLQLLDIVFVAPNIYCPALTKPAGDHLVKYSSNVIESLMLVKEISSIEPSVIMKNMVVIFQNTSQNRNLNFVL